jgi:hypothetical protein
MLHAHESAVTSPEQKLCIDERAQKCCARRGIQAPQTTSLRFGQPQTRHLEKLPLNATEHILDCWGDLRCHSSLPSVQVALTRGLPFETSN